jgi:type I restriction enzyme, S subunit
MSSVDEFVGQRCPNGVRHQPLGSLVTFHRGPQLKSTDLVPGPYPVVTASRQQTASHADWNQDARSVTVTSHGAYAGHVNYWTMPIWLANNVFLLEPAGGVLSPRFLYFCLKRAERRLHEAAQGGGVPYINVGDIAGIQLPVPPIEVQLEIVRILDSFTALEAELEAEMEARRRQYEHYRSSLLAFAGRADIRPMALKDVCTSVFTGGTPLVTRAEYYGGDIPWLRTQEVGYAEIHHTSVRITNDGLHNSSARWVRPNSVIVAISGAGATRGRSAITKIPLTTNQHCCNLEIDESRANYRYVYYWLVQNYENLRSLGQGNRSDLNVGIIKNFPIAVPPLADQEWAANILDKFDALVNDLSIGLPAELRARRQQYEHYRDQLLTFKELAA